MGRKGSFANFLYFLVKIWAEKVILEMDFTLILLYPLYSPSGSIIVTNRISSLLWIMLYLTEPVLEVNYPRVLICHLLPSTSTSVCPSFFFTSILIFPRSQRLCSLCVLPNFQKRTLKIFCAGNFSTTACWSFSLLTKCFQLLDSNFIKSLLSNGSLMGPSFSLFNQFIVLRGKNSLI